MTKYLELNNMVKIKKDGKYQFEMDREAVRDYMVNYVNDHMHWTHHLNEKLDYMFENNYYDKSLFDKYKFSQIKKLYQIAYDKKFRFPSFMSAYKFYTNYALKTNDGKRFLERYEDRVVVNAMYFAKGDFEKAKRFVEVLMEQGYQPATPTFLNIGRARSGEKVSCFELLVPDTTEGINYVTGSSSQLSRIGGGVAIDLSFLRAHGDPIKGIEGASSGVVGVAKILEETFSHFNQLG
jgi:ribonucleoside-diphosphate reductase alpha chain